MELALVGGLGAIGYLLSKDDKNKEPMTISPQRTDINETPSQDHVYSSQHFNKSLQNVINRVDSNFQQASQDFDMNNPNQQHNQGIGLEGGVVPDNLKHVNTDKTVYSRLADIDFKKEEFTHGGMLPFFSSNVTQPSIDNTYSKSVLDLFTGTSTNEFWKSKREVENFGDIKNNMQNVSGVENSLEFQQTRYETPKIMNNTLPFEQVRVGPGFNDGYTAEPSGGFGQNASRDWCQDTTRTVDDLRVLTNPKLSFEGRIVDGQKEQLPGEIGEVCKNRVDTFYEQTEDMYLKGGASSALKEKQRPCIDLKQTHRTDTQLKPHNLNLKRAVDSLTVPLQDLVRLSKKEYLVMHPRPLGNFQNTNPPKLTVYDNNDILRTTIKETTIHDTREGYVGTVKTTYYSPDDVAKVTIGETTEEGQRQFGNVAGGVHQKGDGYDNTVFDAKDTDRALQAYDSAYTGTAQSANDKPMSYADKKNAVINDVKEVLLVNRKPTKTSVKLYNEIDFTNLNHKKLECDYANYRQTQAFNHSQGYDRQTPNTQQVNLTSQKEEYRQLNRINPEILSPLGRNPYAKPLNVF